MSYEWENDLGELRQRLAQEAARIMAEEGVKDFAQAKRKAAQRLHAGDRVKLPSNSEIEAALRRHQALFHADEHSANLRRLRQTAVEAMKFFSRFRPRLAGNVLEGTAGANAEIDLHLFADTPEELVLFLMDQQIPVHQSERQVKLGGGQQQAMQVFSFYADDVPVVLWLFEGNHRQAPLSPVDGRPLRRANVAAVEALLNDADAA